MTEPVEDPSSGRCAVTDEEEQHFLELRETVQKSLITCQPYWLRNTLAPLITPDQAQAVISQYRLLAGRTKCKNSEDKLRALCPMLANIPVENQGELLRLLGEISACAPRGSLDNAAMAALKQGNHYSYLDITKAALPHKNENASKLGGKSSFRDRMAATVRKSLHLASDATRKSLHLASEARKSLHLTRLDSQDLSRSGNSMLGQNSRQHSRQPSASSPQDSVPAYVIGLREIANRNKSRVSMPHGTWQDMTTAKKRQQNREQPAAQGAQAAASHPFAPDTFAIAETSPV